MSEQKPSTHKRHWSFVVTDTKYLFPMVSLLWAIGISLALFLNEPNHINRIGNFIIGIGVWMTMRYTFREGINRHKSALDNQPVIPSNGRLKALNARYFNNVGFSIGDAYHQIYGFIIVLLGSITSSYGDKIFCLFLECKNF